MTFEGKQYFVDGPDGNKLDCMFFPCTQKEEVELFEKQGFDYFENISQPSSHTSLNATMFDKCFNKEYLTKPTVIMCNPNALYY